MVVVVVVVVDVVVVIGKLVGDEALAASSGLERGARWLDERDRLGVELLANRLLLASRVGSNHKKPSAGPGR